MNTFTIPVSMVAGKGKGGAAITGLIALLIVLAIASRRDPTVRK